MTTDDEHNANHVIGLLRSFGLTVNVSRNRVGVYTLSATDTDGQRYELTGDALYPLTIALAEQVGVEDMD